MRTTATTNTHPAAPAATSHHRARWAAVGAAIAVSVGAGGIGISHAVVDTPEPMPIFTAITPCRLIDTRADVQFHIGPHDTLTADETITVAGWGDVDGDCDLSSASSALELNVTAVSPSAATVLTVYPAGEERPNASNLNPTPGQPPTPNSVTATLNGSGEFAIWNAFGSVDVVVDVVGYYEDHQHTGDDIVDGTITGADVADHSLTVGDVANETGVVTAYEEGPVRPLPGNLLQLGAWTPIVSAPIRVPSNGYLDIEVSGTFVPDNDAELNGATCQLGLNQDTIDYSAITFVINDLGGSSQAPVSFNSHRTIPVSADDNPALMLAGQSVELLCHAYGVIAMDSWSGEFRRVQLTATFVPTAYSPVMFHLPPVPYPLPDIIVGP